MTPRRLVFLDVDGTLLDHRQRLSPSAARAVRGARRAGHLVFLSTGRSRAEVPAHVSDLGFDGVVSAGGGFVDRDGELLIAHTLPEDAVETIVAFLERRRIEYSLQAYEGVYPSPGLAARLAALMAVHGVDLGADAGENGPGPTARVGRGRPRGGVVAKATFFGQDASTFAAVRDGLGERFWVITGTMPYLGEAGGEVTLPGINKGAAIAELVGLLGMTTQDAIAIGDGANDLEMLETVGVGIAMGNADDAVKARADEVTDAVDRDGVYNAFVRHGLLDR